MLEDLNARGWICPGSEDSHLTFILGPSPTLQATSGHCLEALLHAKVVRSEEGENPDFI